MSLETRIGVAGEALNYGEGDENYATESTMPLAIVGMSCRFSGDATDPERLFKMCSEARDGWSEIPKDRYNVDAFYHPDPGRCGAVSLS
jgi:acyl transferase domain-containing protein